MHEEFVLSGTLPEITGTSALRVGVVYWQQSDGIASPINETLRSLGCVTTSFLHNTTLPKGLDVVLACGPFGSLVPLARQLLTCPPTQRPLFVLWMIEPFPNPAIPEWIRYPISVLRSRLERVAFQARTPEKQTLRLHLRCLTARAHRFRFYGDLYWLRQQGILSVLAIPSHWNAEMLRDRGFHPIVAHEGAPPDWGINLGLERDTAQRSACLCGVYECDSS